MTIRNWRFDVVELAAVSAFMVSIGLAGGYSRASTSMNARTLDALSAESRALARTYGPETHSAHEEERIVRDLFGDKRDGVFVDVGANDYQRFSNTYYLETTSGWSGIAVEPLREFEAGYLAHRPQTRFRAFFVSDASNEMATMYYLKENTLVTSADKTFTARRDYVVVGKYLRADTQNLYFTPLAQGDQG